MPIQEIKKKTLNTNISTPTDAKQQIKTLKYRHKKFGMIQILN